MPTDHECSTRKLGFSVGTYHYHSFDSGYLGRDLLVCTKCGVQHAVEVPSDDSVPFRQESLSEPVIDCPQLAGYCLLLPDHDWGRQTASASRDPSQLHCHFCNTAGNIVSAIVAGDLCPRCGRILPKPISQWMT